MDVIHKNLQTFKYLFNLTHLISKIERIINH